VSLKRNRPGIPVFEGSVRRPVGLATAWRLRYAVEGLALTFDEAAAAADHVDPSRGGGGRHTPATTRCGRLGAISRSWLDAGQVGMGRCDGVVGWSRVIAARRLPSSCAWRSWPRWTEQVERGRELYHSAQRDDAELGPSVLAASTSTEVATVEILAGDLDAAERQLRSDNEALKEIGEKYLRSSVVALLARVLMLKARGPRRRALRARGDGARRARTMSSAGDCGGRYWPAVAHGRVRSTRPVRWPTRRSR
jgi:hypothetical protein